MCRKSLVLKGFAAAAARKIFIPGGFSTCAAFPSPAKSDRQLRQNAVLHVWLAAGADKAIR